MTPPTILTILVDDIVLRVCTLDDPPLDEPVRARADGRLGDAELGGDLGERPPTVLLEVLDDPLVELGDLVDRRSAERTLAHQGVDLQSARPIRRRRLPRRRVRAESVAGAGVAVQIGRAHV